MDISAVGKNDNGQIELPPLEHNPKSPPKVQTPKGDDSASSPLPIKEKKIVNDLENKEEEQVMGRVSQIELIETTSSKEEKTPILKSDGKNLTYEDVLKKSHKGQDCLFHTRTEESKDLKAIAKTAVTHNKVLMSQSILSLKVHEPEDQPGWTKVDRLFKLKYLLLAVGLLYILITNFNNLNEQKSSNIKIATFDYKLYPMSSALTPVKFFYNFEQQDIKNRMDCELNYEIPSCLNYCQSVIKFWPGNFTNVWDCLDRYTKISPSKYGQMMCDDLYPGNGYKDQNEMFKCVKNNLQYDDSATAEKTIKSREYKKLVCNGMKLKVSETKDPKAWQECHDKSKIAYTLDDCKLINNIKKGTKEKQRQEDILKCIQNPNTDKIEITREICNQIYPYANPNTDDPSYPIDAADLGTLNDRYACYDKLVQPIGNKIDREYCDNSTQTKVDFLACLKKHNLKKLADDVLSKREPLDPYWEVGGFSPEQAKELAAQGVKVGAQSCFYGLFVGQLALLEGQSSKVPFSKPEFYSCLKKYNIPSDFVECKWEPGQDPFYLFQFPLEYISTDGSKKPSLDCLTSYQNQYKKWKEFPNDYQNPDEFMAKTEPQCKKRNENVPQLKSCLSKKGITQSVDEYKLSNKNFCEKQFKDDEASRYICLYVTQHNSMQFLKERCLHLNFVQKDGGFNYPLVNKYRCMNTGNIYLAWDPEQHIQKCLLALPPNNDQWGNYLRLPNQKMEECLQRFEDQYNMGFKTTVFFTEGLIYKNVSPKVKVAEPLKSKSTYEDQIVQNYLCKRVGTKLLTSPFTLWKNVTDRATQETSVAEVMMNYAEYNLSCKVLADPSGKYMMIMDFPNGPLPPTVIKDQIDVSGALSDVKVDEIVSLTLNKSESYTFEYQTTLSSDLDFLDYTQGLWYQALNMTEGEVNTTQISTFDDYSKFLNLPGTRKIFMQLQRLQAGVNFNNPVDVIMVPETAIIIGKYWNSTMRELISNNAKYYKGDSTSDHAIFEKLSMEAKYGQIQPNATLNQRTLTNKMILFQSNLITTTHYFNLGDILAKFGGIFATFSAFFAGVGALFVHSFVQETAMLLNRKQWYKAYKELIQIQKEILQSEREHLDSTDLAELDEINELSLETYLEGETCMRRLEALIQKHKLTENPRILEKQSEIVVIMNTDLYDLIAQLKLIFSLLGLYKMDRKLKKRKIAIAEVKDEIKNTYSKFEERLKKLEEKAQVQLQ